MNIVHQKTAEKTKEMQGINTVRIKQKTEVREEEERKLTETLTSLHQTN